jgi:23S rRNA (uracil1939-C5)-methyltransferase
MLSPGQRIDLAVDQPAAGGRMIARVGGQVVLVSGAIPGERIVAEIERVAKGVAYARTIEVAVPSPDRRDPFTDPDCGGCVYAHVDYARQLTLKADILVDAFSRIGRMVIEPPVVRASSPTDGYRMRARLHLRDGRLGFFREGTHTLCDARSTRQLLPATCDAVERLAEALLVASGVSQTSGVFQVQELEIAENLDASSRAVHLASAAPLDGASLANLPACEGLTGLTVTGVGGDVATVMGSPYVEDHLEVGGVSVLLRRHVLAFFQANRHLLRDLVAHVMQQVPASGRVLDLYAGVGLFAVPLAARGDVVVAVEGDRVSARDLEENGRTSGGSIDASRQPVETFLARRPTRPDTLIVDPPRTGMSREALTGAIMLAVPRVVYVSCDVATLARDARRLADAGYSLTHLAAFDMFPSTAHVEAVVVFDRA